MNKNNRIFRFASLLALLFAFGLITGGVSAQTTFAPETATGGSVQDWDMVWSGRVDDTVRVSVRNRSARTITVSGQRTTGISSNFRNRLPTNRNVRVSVRKRDGRGSVNVIQQPTNRNNHTALIEIRDSSGGADFYRFELSWNGGSDFEDDYRPGNPNYSGNGEMTWQGRVDDRVQVRVRNRIATTRTVSGRRYNDARYNFRRGLPSSSVNVSVDKRSGRGSVRVIEQPSRYNGYSALVEIRDTAGGADFYSFELNWSGGNTGPVYPGNQGGGSMTWRGSVDDTVQVRIRNRTAQTITRSGQDTRNISFSFNGSLPRGNAYVRVDKRDGRGSVRVIQQPSSRNGYTAIIEIRDSSGGRDNYRFDLVW